jgi:hypothetical protein
MSHTGWLFWIIAPFAFFWVFGGWRRRTGWGRMRDRHRLPREAQDPELLKELDEQRTYIEGLEGRIAELENRLDFAERLIATSREPANGVHLE